MTGNHSSSGKMKRSVDRADESQDVTEPPPTSKRQRVSRACDQCRAAREKCDGIQPTCFPCASQNRGCSWNEPKKKRGVQTGYIRTLELSLGWIFDKIPGSEDALQGLLTHEGGQGRALLLGKDTAAGNRIHRRWRRSIVQQEIDRVLSGIDAGDAKVDKVVRMDERLESDHESDEGAKRERSIFDPTAMASDASISAWPHASSEFGDSSSLRTAQADGILNSSLENQSTEPAISPIPSDGRTGLAPEIVRLPANCWRLLDIYFAYTHCWFPVLDKALVQKTCWSYPEAGLHLTAEEIGSGSHAELWAALALSAYQDQASLNLSDCDEGRQKPDVIYRVARGLLPLEIAEYKARHANAALLLAMINIARREFMAAWILIGIATRIALHLGLRSQSIAESQPRQQHTYMACFILDDLVSACLGQPSHLRAEDTHRITQLGANDQDEWAIWAPCPGFGTLQSFQAISRSPARAFSSFALLHDIHRAYTINTSSRDLEFQTEKSCLTQVQARFGDDESQRSVKRYVTHGGSIPNRLPSVYLLRVAFLCCGHQSRALSDSVFAEILECIEEHLLDFGTAIPPFFPANLELISRSTDIKMLKPETQDRWQKIVAAIESVWTTSRPYGRTTQENGNHSAVIHRPSDTPLGPNTSNARGVVTQLPTPSSHYAETPAAQLQQEYDNNHQNTSYSRMSNFSSTSRMPQTMNMANPYGSISSREISRFDIMGNIPQHYSTYSRPPLSAATFDYDAILDDIASLNEADQTGIDPQFMTNLGFAPGSDLDEVLRQDYGGI